jgi:adenine-specific DNA-methyltransferase
MLHNLSIEPGMHVLEPCAGDGVFIDALCKSETSIQLDAYEFNPEAVSLLQAKYRPNSNIFIAHADTLVDEELTLYANMGGIYDRIIANPPYGAWQDYKKRKDLKSLYPDMYVKETYALFLLRCIRLLNEGGIFVCIVPDTFLNLHMHTTLREVLLTSTKIREIALFPSSFFPNVSFGYSNLCIITLEKTHSKDACFNNAIRVLTGFKQVEDVGSPIACGTRYTLSQRDIYNHPQHAFFIADDAVTQCLRISQQTIGDIADCVTGIYTGNDKHYLRPLHSGIRNSKDYLSLNSNLICTHYMERDHLLEGIDGAPHFVPIMKGGAVKYVKPDLWYIDWSIEAIRAYKTDKKARFQNANYYFREGIGVPMVSSSQVTASLIEHRVFDQSIVGIFPHDPRWTYYLLAFFNSPTCNKLLRTINPTANNSANYIKKIPFIVPDDEVLETINGMVEGMIVALKRGEAIEGELEQVVHKMIRDVYGC